MPKRCLILCAPREGSDYEYLGSSYIECLLLSLMTKFNISLSSGKLSPNNVPPPATLPQTLETKHVARLELTHDEFFSPFFADTY